MRAEKCKQNGPFGFAFLNPSRLLCLLLTAEQCLIDRCPCSTLLGTCKPPARPAALLGGLGCWVIEAPAGVQGAAFLPPGLWSELGGVISARGRRQDAAEARRAAAGPGLAGGGARGARGRGGGRTRGSTGIWSPWDYQLAAAAEAVDGPTVGRLEWTAAWLACPPARYE